MDGRLSDEHDAAYALFEAGKHQEALERYRALAEQGSVTAQVHLGWAHQMGKGVAKDMEKAREWYREAAETGSPLGQHYLALLLIAEGHYAPAIEWLNRAASQDYLPAIYRLGRLYETGKGVERNEEKAYEYFEQAAGLGHLFSKRAVIGKMIKGGYGLGQIPRGLCGFIALMWAGLRIASKNLDDDRVRT